MVRKRQVVKSRVLRIDRCPKRHRRLVDVLGQGIEEGPNGNTFEITFVCQTCDHIYRRRGRFAALSRDEVRFFRRAWKAGLGMDLDEARTK